MAFLWTVFMLVVSTLIWRTGRAHSKPELGYSSVKNHREELFARFVRKMSATAIGLCLLSALLVWSSFFWAIVAILAIPGVAAFQVYNRKRSIEASGNRSLPLR